MELENILAWKSRAQFSKDVFLKHYKYNVLIQPGHMQGEESLGQTHLDTDSREMPQNPFEKFMLARPDTQVYILDEVPGFYHIGRSSNCEIVLPSPKVSGVHARVRVFENRVELVDMSSTNGTAINNTKLNPDEVRIVNDEDVIQVPGAYFAFYSPEKFYEVLQEVFG